MFDFGEIKKVKKTTTGMNDHHGRKISYLRLSVTDRCNLKCLYCRPSGWGNMLHHKEILTYEELLRFVKIAVKNGITKVRVTGGEPLVRKGVVDFIERLRHIRGLNDISLTTNGLLLKDNLECIYAAGVRRLNISLDTLKRDRFLKLTGFDKFESVWEAILQAREMNFSPIKLNMVVLKGLNDDEIVDMAMLTKKYDIHVRFIEYMPIGALGKGLSFETIPVSGIRERLENSGKLIPVSGGQSTGPAERFRFLDAPGEVGFIGSMSQHFCHACNRIRLSSTGHLRPCLLSDIQEDIKGPIRSGASDHELSKILNDTVLKKPREHFLTSASGPRLEGRMSAIGG